MVVSARAPWAVTVDDVARWQDHRQMVVEQTPGASPTDAGHQVVHIIKALGPMAAVAEHRDHGEPDTPIDSRRAADLIIHAIWLVRSCGFDPAQVVAERIDSFSDDFKPWGRA